MGKDWPGLGKVSTGASAQEGTAVGQALMSEQSTRGSELTPVTYRKSNVGRFLFFFLINHNCPTEKDKPILKRSMSSVNGT